MVLQLQSSVNVQPLQVVVVAASPAQVTPSPIDLYASGIFLRECCVVLIRVLLLWIITSHHQALGRPVACNSDFEILEARHLLDADMFPMFSVGWTWQEFVAI